MSFFEDIATALDAEAIESRVHNDTMFIPITSDLEIQFVEIDPHLPAANVYIAAADADDVGQDFEAALVSVVFSVEDAVKTVASHVATDQVVTVLKDLLEGTDERIEDLEFIQAMTEDNMVFAELTEYSGIQVTIEVLQGMPTATVDFMTLSPVFEQTIASATEQISLLMEEHDLSEVEAEEMLNEIAIQAMENCREVLELGSFTDFDKLFDVLSLAADQAEAWEEQLVPLDDDEPEIYDLFGADDDDPDFYFDDFDEVDDEEEDIDYTDR